MSNKIIWNVSPLSADIVDEFESEGFVLISTIYDTDRRLWKHTFEYRI